MNNILESEDDTAAWMRELAAIPLDLGPLPDPRQLWWKAELLKRWDARRQPLAAIDRAEPAQIWIGLAGAAVLLMSAIRSLTASPGLIAAAALTLVVLATVAVVAARDALS